MRFTVNQNHIYIKFIFKDYYIYLGISVMFKKIQHKIHIIYVC